MTTSETFSSFPPPPVSGQRRLRRNRSNRVAAGVASGLGDYFGIDPVLFRVLFATSAFFGGAGILAYLLAWAAIPEEGTQHAPIDGWVSALRRRKVPVWLIVVVGGLFLWIAAFSWWAPGPLLPVLAIVVLMVVFFTRREFRAATPPAAAPISFAKTDTVATESEPAAPPADQPTWVGDARAWFEESRAAARLRRRRSLPIRLGVLIALVVDLVSLGIADAVHGVQFQWYFWSVLMILAAGILAGLVSRRWSWSLLTLVAPAVVGAVAFAGSHASLHDGIGQREWKPTAAPAAQYKLMFGQGILDLRKLPAVTTPTTIDVTMGAGQVKVIAPKSMNLTVEANLHFGRLDVDGRDNVGHGGVGLSRTVDPPAGATGAPITVDIHVADGNIAVFHE
jgi:phage shock protein PspC (stress-responsive transcriptional regulator)